MNAAYEFLTEHEAMWAEMLMQVLRDCQIPCTALPVYGTGLTMRAGIRERLRIFVPTEKMPQAEELLGELFPACENESSQAERHV